MWERVCSRQYINASIFSSQYKQYYTTICVTTFSETVTRTIKLKFFPFSTLILVGQLLLLTMFWVCTFLSRKMEFTKHYLVSSFAPMTLAVILKTAISTMLTFGGVPSTDKWVGLLYKLDDYFDSVYRNVFTVNSFVYIIMTLRVAQRRRAIVGMAGWVPYYLISIPIYIACLWLWVDLKTRLYLDIQSWLSIASSQIIFVIFIMMIVMCCAGCICTDPRPDQDFSDPVVYNAKSRMGWSIIFLLCIPIALNLGFLEYESVRLGDTGLFLVGKGIKLITPYLILVPVFLLLPTYRSVLFFCCATDEKKQKHDELNTTKPIEPINSTAQNSIMQATNSVLHQDTAMGPQYEQQVFVGQPEPSWGPGTQYMGTHTQGPYPATQGYFPNGQPQNPLYLDAAHLNYQSLKNQAPSMGYLPQNNFGQPNGGNQLMVPGFNPQPAYNPQMAGLHSNQFQYGNQQHQNVSGQQTFPQNQMNRRATQPNLTVLTPPPTMLHLSSSYSNTRRNTEPTSPHFVA